MYFVGSVTFCFSVLTIRVVVHGMCRTLVVNDGCVFF